MHIKVKQTIVEIICKPLSEIYNSADLVSDLGMDSMERVELVITLEEDYNIKIADEVAEKWRTVDDVINCVEKAVNDR